jgi:hypothetical protein
MEILNLYYIFLPIILYCFITTPIKNYKPIGWFYKTILLYISLFFIVFSMLKNNIIINNYILPFLLFINIEILLFIILTNDYNTINLIPIIGIIYLLYTFNYKDFKFQKGKLINPNKKWIIEHVIILSLFYLLSNKDIIKNFSKSILILLVIFPLFFPLNEYVIYRLLTLTLVVALNWKFFSN